MSVKAFVCQMAEKSGREASATKMPERGSFGRKASANHPSSKRSSSKLSMQSSIRRDGEASNSG
ncbi:hypothetical protein [Cohnella rhizosphaerae]|uniref:Uncharacterized protein n=1 Tax=Cohnella rhizosphaerae TaxID=1457232 RepID=A0A9X4KQS8_9BACL|nr:hypothetical protein [Cohnella rhizosphaerae]MDG0809072.1 hypothetical protein [Cohnella rhizosphaerae]